MIFSTSTNGPGNGPLKSQVQGVVVISGSYSPIPINGTSNNIVDNYVPVGARSFTVDGEGVLNVGDTVIIHRPSTANWISAIGMDSNYLNTPWQPGTVDVDEERVVTRIEGNRVMIDEPITTALDQKYGGGSIYAFTWPQRFNNIGIENLRGVSTYDINNIYDEDHAWTFLRFSDTRNLVGAQCRLAVFRQILRQHPERLQIRHGHQLPVPDANFFNLERAALRL